MTRVGIYIGALIFAFMLGAFVDRVYNWPFGVPSPPPPAPSVAKPATSAVPTYSRAQGAQDAPRNDPPQGATTDLQRCINTMLLRNEKLAEAQMVCQKIMNGIGR